MKFIYCRGLNKSDTGWATTTWRILDPETGLQALWTLFLLEFEVRVTLR